MLKRILFILAALMLLGTSLYARGRSAATATAQAQVISQHDAAGADVTTELANLQAYAKTHMGVDVKVTLSGAYAKAQTAAKAAAAASATNSQIYADAQRACAGKTDSVTQARCNQQYLDNHLVNVPQTTPMPEPKLADYQRSIRSPFWTPDLAGALIIGAVVALVMALMVGRRRRSA